MAVLEATVERLTGELDAVASRLAALEARVGEGVVAVVPISAAVASPSPAPAESAPEIALEIPAELAIPDRHTLLRFVTLGGRSLMVLGGAYLLRAHDRCRHPHAGGRGGPGPALRRSLAVAEPTAQASPVCPAAPRSTA